MTYLTDLLVLVTTMIVFLMNVDFKFSKRRTIVLFILFGSISFMIYTLLLNQGFERVLLSTLCFSIPSFGFCFWISKYKGARFIFTFATIDFLGMIVVILGRSISIPFGFDQTMIFFTTTILLVVYVTLSLLFRKQYLNMLRNVTTGWGYMALASVMMYIFTIVLVGYPTPLDTRREYIPTILVYIVVAFVFLKVIYEAAENNIKIYNEKMEKDYLKMELELNQVYYDMAYKDGLTGIKNRRAFEEYLNQTEKVFGKELICISMDINNLKRVNDEMGHHAGDELIKEFSLLLKNTFEKEENIFRVGGDEFIIIVENETNEWLDDKFTKMDNESKTVSQSTKIQLEYAKGRCLGKSKDIRDLLKTADKEMYKDKILTKI